MTKSIWYGLDNNLITVKELYMSKREIFVMGVVECMNISSFTGEKLDVSSLTDRPFLRFLKDPLRPLLKMVFVRLMIFVLNRTQTLFESFLSQIFSCIPTIRHRSSTHPK